MNLYYFKNTKYSNFGDELNDILFNKLFSKEFNSHKNKNIDFYGIGSIIDNRISTKRKSVFFGTGIRDVTKTYNTTNFDIRFVRGPITSNILGFKGKKVIADAAYALLNTPELLPTKPHKKKFKFSLMPHYKQMNKVNWHKIEKITNIHIIDPRKDCFHIMDEIASTEKLLTIAMHGAIVADILRVPWLRMKMEAIDSEIPLVTEIKWTDFLIPLNLKDAYIKINNYQTFKKSKSIIRILFLIELILKLIKSKKNIEFQLSSPVILEKIKLLINKEIKSFKKDYS